MFSYNRGGGAFRVVSAAPDDNTARDGEKRNTPAAVTLSGVDALCATRRPGRAEQPAAVR